MNHSQVNPAATLVTTYTGWDGRVPYIPVAANLSSITGASRDSRLDPSLPRIQADPGRLAQVFTNLVSNAIKFTESGTIEIGGAPENGDEIKLWVKDSGVGIPADEIGDLFEKYRQTQSGKTSKHKGTGLGLVICKMIVESHGGKIWAESEAGKGTTFFFTLPATRENPV